MQNSTPQDLQTKFERYKHIQYQKVHNRAKLTKLISDTTVLCALALAGLAAATRGSAQRHFVIGSVGATAIMAGANVARRINDKHTFKEINRVRQTFLMDDNRA